MSDRFKRGILSQNYEAISWSTKKLLGERDVRELLARTLVPHLMQVGKWYPFYVGLAFLPT